MAKSKKSKNITLIVIFILVVILGVGIGLYFLLHKPEPYDGKQCPANIFNIDNASKLYDEFVPNGFRSRMICDEGFYPNTRNPFQNEPREFTVRCKNGNVDNYNNTTCIQCDTSDQGEYTKYCGMHLQDKFNLTSPIYNTTVENCRKSCNDDQNCGAFSFRENTCYLKKKGDYTLTGISDVDYDPSYHLYIKNNQEEKEKSCDDSEYKNTDSYGDGCPQYKENPGWCGEYDDTKNFKSSNCCACK